MADVRELKIKNMWAWLNRIQDATLDDTDPDEDEIYGVGVVFERRQDGSLKGPIVIGSDTAVEFNVGMTGKWTPLPLTGDWLRRDFNATSDVIVEWALMEEDSIGSSDIGEAVQELTNGLLEELVEVVPSPVGMERTKRILGLLGKFLEDATSDDLLGRHRKVFRLALDNPSGTVTYQKRFRCLGNNADYWGWADATLGPKRTV